MSASQNCGRCGHTWNPRAKGFSYLCPRCMRETPLEEPAEEATPPAQLAPLSLDDSEQLEPLPPVRPSLGRRAFWTTTLFASIVAILALHVAAFAIFFFAVKGEPEVAVQPAEQVAQAPEKSKATSPPRPPKARVEKARPSETPDPPGELPDPKPEPRPATIPPTPVPVEPTPEPKNTVNIAPHPHHAVRLPVPDRAGWTSEWDRNGDIRVRVRAVSLAALPTIDVDKVRSYTAEKHLVIWLEIQNVSEKPHTYRRWQPVTSGQCSLFTPAGSAMAIVIFPNKHRFDWTEEYERKLEPGAEPLLETVFFSAPEEERPEYELRLNAANVGEKYLFRFAIPGKVLGK